MSRTENPYDTLDKWLTGVSDGDAKHRALRFRAELESALSISLADPAYDSTVSTKDVRRAGRTVKRIELLELLHLRDLKINPNQRSAYSIARRELTTLVGKNSIIWDYESSHQRRNVALIHDAIAAQLFQRVRRITK
ncbi:MAG TPA: hypothetical protein VLF20_01675 [Patescibacteria group bacterium]|nr:hypothetical protein [Patescibacteria group bacterium]